MVQLQPLSAYMLTKEILTGASNDDAIEENALVVSVKSDANDFEKRRVRKEIHEHFKDYSAQEFLVFEYITYDLFGELNAFDEAPVKSEYTDYDVEYIVNWCKEYYNLVSRDDFLFRNDFSFESFRMLARMYASRIMFDDRFSHLFDKNYEWGTPQKALLEKRLNLKLRLRTTKNQEEVTSKVAQPTAPPEMPNGDEPPPLQDLTTRGTPRVRKLKRTRQAVGGDPNAESHRFDVKLGGRIPRELRDDFVDALAKSELNQGAVLTEIIESYLDKLDRD